MGDCSLSTFSCCLPMCLLAGNWNESRAENCTGPSNSLDSCHLEIMLPYVSTAQSATWWSPSWDCTLHLIISWRIHTIPSTSLHFILLLLRFIPTYGPHLFNFKHPICCPVLGTQDEQAVHGGFTQTQVKEAHFLLGTQRPSTSVLI